MYMSTKLVWVVFGLIVGNALLTVATGKLSEGESERAGLVTTHAYAVLNLADIKVCAVYLTPAICFPSQCSTAYNGTCMYILHVGTIRFGCILLRVHVCITVLCLGFNQYYVLLV